MLLIRVGRRLIESNLLKTFACTIFFLGWFTNSNGTILTTTSGINGLEWVDFKDTYGYSREYVENNLLSKGNLYEGYRYATRLETITLLNSYSADSITEIDNGWQKSSTKTTHSFLTEFGATNSINFNYPNTLNTADGDILEIDKISSSMFLYGDSFKNPTVEDYLFSPFGSLQCAYFSGDPVAGYLHPQTTDLNYIGQPAIAVPLGTNTCNAFSLLVRDTATPVPEPTSILLVLTGLATLAGFARKTTA